MVKRVQTVKELIKAWMCEPYDPDTRAEVKKLVQANKREQLEEYFGKPLEFGTGGVRAIMGVGTSLMNLYTVQMVIQGYANWFNKTYKGEKVSVALCHDNRHFSREFAEIAARVFAGNKILVYLTENLRPTPFESFAIRHYKCHGGVNFTASHNPKEYNGIKIYDAEGCQVLGDPAVEIMNAVHEVKSMDQVKIAPKDDGQIKIIGEDVEKLYRKKVAELALNAKQNREHGKELTIVYTNLHGAGITMIPETLEDCGFLDLHLTPGQDVIDGCFPTASYPNPEMDAAMKLSWAELEKLDADIVLASDPDADRLSVSANVNGKPVRLTGNEFAVLLTDYLIEMRKPKNDWATIMSIVSTPMVKEITEKSGGSCVEVLTGFKYIGELIHQWEKTPNSPEFLMGFEESLGYLVGTFVRDKDATIPAMYAAEMALHYKLQGKTLIDRLHELYAEHGLYREGQRVLRFDDTPDVPKKILPRLRKALPTIINNVNIIRTVDYLEQSELPKSDVLAFHLDDGSRITLRPSGTEATFKIYVAVNAPTKDPKNDVEKVDQKLNALLDYMENYLKD